MSDEQGLSPKALATRRRLREDFDFYAKHCLKIRDKESQIVPLRLNEAQKILHEVVERQLRTTGRIRVVILKGRQQGLSTYVGARNYFNVSQHRAKKAAVVTHTSDSTNTLFDMTKRYHVNCPEYIRPSTSRSSKKELLFGQLDSAYRVATAGGDGVMRGETITDLHASEVAFWRPSVARENWNGLRQSVPDAPGTAIFVESTANGYGNLFYELWQGAVSGTNGYEAVFVPWFKSPEYSSPVPDNWEASWEEKRLAEKYGLSDEQLVWRRRMVAESGLDLFKQEYPCCAEEAFLTSGRPAFIPEQLKARMEMCTTQPDIMALEGDKFEKHPRGELKVYAPPEPSECYYIGADVGSGIRGPRHANGEYTGDPSVAQVLDSKKRQVAVWRGYVLPDMFAHVLYALGEMYNWAQIACENNNHGILPNHILYHDLEYPDVYQTTKVDETTQREMKTLGFTTSSKTRPMIINGLRGAMRGRGLTLNDLTTLREMATFVENEAGKFEAEAGNHDDTVISLGIAYHIHEGDWDTTSPVPDEMYTEAI